MSYIRKATISSCIALTVGSVSVQAANWLALQGTEPAGASERANVWGFVQPEYQYTDGTELKAGPFAGKPAQFNQIGPDLDTNSTFSIRRARLGVRGTGFPLDSNVNYFLLLEAGNNGITSNGGGSVKVTDASVTLNHIKGARFRIGQFKYPGSEEGLMAIHVFDYINFTNVTNMMLLERFFDSDGSVTSVGANDPNGSVGAFRDVGVQVFDWFNTGNWEHSYAAMIGNGNGIARGDDNNDKDLTLYWASERVFGGEGARRQGLKLYAWHQQGKRTLATGPTQTVGDFDRTRWGLGSTFRKDKYRASAEYIKADGMIFNGTDGAAVPGTLNNAATAVASWNILPEDEADGWYIDAGYKVLPNIELDLRYDTLNRATKTSSEERTFTTWTAGAQYSFNKKTRLIFNYELRDAEAPNLAGSAVPNQILDGMDDRVSVQLLAIF
ncbi:MAG: OprO/OprP family phosphate-selective porin [Gammaproteobacteria bacterium]|nr:OprO/OprP family phosphate-selective porin [Gammaproteobacteria bacterium]